MSCLIAEDAESPKEVQLKLADCLRFYMPSFCEENVWNILNYASSQGIPDESLFAVFISNGKRCVPFQKQKNESSKMFNVCFWDYHVIPIILSKSRDGRRRAFVYDMDSTLPYPSSVQNYVQESILTSLPNGVTYSELRQAGMRHMFRVVPYSELLKLFSSDRRHMLLDRNKWKHPDRPEYISTPPSAPCISATKHTHPHTLPLFLRMPDTRVDDNFQVPTELGHMLHPGILLQGVQEFVQYFKPRDLS